MLTGAARSRKSSRERLRYAVVRWNYQTSGWKDGIQGPGRVTYKTAKWSQNVPLYVRHENSAMAAHELQNERTTFNPGLQPQSQKYEDKGDTCTVYSLKNAF